MMLDVRSIIIVGVVSFFIGVMGAWWLTASYKDNKYTAEIQTHNAQAAQALADAHAQTNLVNEQREAVATESEVKFAKQQQELDKIRNDNLRLISGRVLLDKTDNSGKALSKGTSSKSSTASSSTAELPVAVAEELVGFARDADTAASYATSCYEWVKTLK